ncbi:FAD:protein FMN transferase [Inediibacterium massiliense]|uniref:FAD:protein FMN transferase n=1 Tax=Inediibacterium massiliense TaxID=1658111 RepID=UPI000DA63D06|nr:FAD:protein FMN transferase [Inediibacterium massiliense]
MGKKISIWTLYIFILLIFLSGCSKEIKPVEDSSYMLGTYLKITIWTDDEQQGRQIIKKCFDRIQEIEKKMSINLEDSEINKINHASGENFIKVSQDTSEVLKKSLIYGELSKGAFDPTTGKLVELWGIGTDRERIPSQEEIENALQYVDYHLIKQKDEKYFKLEKKGMRIDLGGIAKGYAADEVYKILKKEKIEHALINLGGNIYAVGNKLDGSHWKIGIQDPLQKTGTHMGTLEISNQAVVTSGNYERFFIQNNQRYHHIIDPYKGYPAENGIISATIVTDQSMDADALSTATYILGVDEGMKLIESLENVECILITQDKGVYVSSGLKEKFNITNEKFQLKD